MYEYADPIYVDETDKYDMDAFLAASGHDVTPAFLAYARPLVGPLPPCETL